MEVILGMSFTSFNNANIRFTEIGDLNWRNYIVVKVLSITKRIDLLDKTEFARAALDENAKIFLLHIAALSILSIYPS